jgi:hypothetical protein
MHFLIRNSATEFDMKTPSHLFRTILGTRNQPGFSGPPQLDPHRKICLVCGTSRLVY